MSLWGNVVNPLDVLKTVGHPVVYYPDIAKYTGSITSAIFLNQLVYWDDKNHSSLGTYKTSDEWQKETGLSYREQVTARKKLRELGLLTETHHRLIHRVYYKLNKEVFNQLILDIFNEKNQLKNNANKDKNINTEKNTIFPNDRNAIGLKSNTYLPNDDNAIREQPNGNSATTIEHLGDDETAFGEQLKSISSNDNNATRYIDKDYQRLHTEITSENTKENDESYFLDKLDFSKWPRTPSKQVWMDFKELRIKKKVPITQTVVNRLALEVQKANQHGINVDDFLAECVLRGWYAGKADWMIEGSERNTSKKFDALAYVNKINMPSQTSFIDMGVIDAAEK